MSRQRRQIFNEINITPLTDIFLVLLIIMMVIAPMLDSKGLKLAVPTAAPDKNVKEDPKVATLKISDAGAFTFDNQPITAEALQAKLFQTKAQYSDGVLIEPTPNALHGKVVQVMDAARGAGITKIAVTQASE